MTESCLKIKHNFINVSFNKPSSQERFLVLLVTSNLKVLHL